MICKSTRPVNPSNSTTQKPSKPLRVLHIIDSTGLYGAEVMLLNLVTEQVKMGLDPIIGSIGQKHISEKPLEAEALRRGLKVQKFRFANGPNCFGAFKILQFCRKENLDIIHSHGYKPNILLGFIPRKLRRVPMISTLHGWTATPKDKKMSLYEWLDSKSMRFIDVLVVVSRSMLDHARLKSRSLAYIHVIHNGIPMGEGASWKSDALTQGVHGLSGSTSQRTNIHLDQSIIDFCQKGFTVGSLGRLSPEKGHRYLIQAIHSLRNDGLDVNLLIIGEGNERKSLEDLVITLGLENRVLLSGYRAEASHYLKFFKAFILPSLAEGMPMTLLEAMRAKVPIIATNVGGIPELLNYGASGLLVERCRPDQIGDALKQILQNRRLSGEITKSAFQCVKARYSAKRMSERYTDVYEKLFLSGIQNLR